MHSVYHINDSGKLLALFLRSQVKGTVNNIERQVTELVSVCLSVCLCLLFTAPAGALMYFRELTGTVRSFNYGPTVGTYHINLFFA
jgi:hypothetical protein